MATAAKNIAESAVTCGGQSFTPETGVLMADGSVERLDQVKVGDKVEATDPSTGKTAAQTVTKVWINHDTDLMDVTIKAGGKTSVVHSTQHHLFWDATTRAWTEADHLAVGDHLDTDHGATAALAATTVVAGAADMWDLTVQTTHDFYVATPAASILVHNCPTMGGAESGIPGVGDTPTKVVNSNMGHIDVERATRAGFDSVRGAQSAVRDLGASIGSSGFPEGTIPDSAHADRLLVPFAENGYAVYQIKPNGNAVFKTILTARIEER